MLVEIDFVLVKLCRKREVCLVLTNDSDVLTLQQVVSTLIRHFSF